MLSKYSENECPAVMRKSRKIRLLSMKKYKVKWQFRSTKSVTAKDKREKNIEEKTKPISKLRLEDEDFTNCISRTVKKLFPDLKISKAAMKRLNSYLNYTFRLMGKLSENFALLRNNTTIAVEELELAIAFTLPGRLAEYVISEARQIAEKLG